MPLMTPDSLASTPIHQLGLMPADEIFAPSSRCFLGRARPIRCRHKFSSGHPKMVFRHLKTNGQSLTAERHTMHNVAMTTWHEADDNEASRSRNAAYYT